MTIISSAAVVMASHTLLAAPARQDPPTGDARAEWKIAGGFRPKRDQFAAEIAAEDVRKLAFVWLVATGARHQVVAVEPDRMHLDQCLAAARLRNGKVGIVEDLGIAVFLENRRLHFFRK